MIFVFSLHQQQQQQQQQQQALATTMMSAQPKQTGQPHLDSTDPYGGAKIPMLYGNNAAPRDGGGSYVPYGDGGGRPDTRDVKPATTAPSLGYHQRPPWPSYSLPAMPGPIMTNVHNPNGPMALFGGSGGANLNLSSGFHSGRAAMQQLQQHQQKYGGGIAAATDRPFKCDQCPQSFNRNHDLKRHKRIHLSIKPFPCPHCDKSFSRKDALKVSGFFFSLLFYFILFLFYFIFIFICLFYFYFYLFI